MPPPAFLPSRWVSTLGVHQTGLGREEAVSLFFSSEEMEGDKFWRVLPQYLL
jgi:hypothetical protein